MAGVTVDTSELRTLARDIAKGVDMGQIRQSVSKGALNIKKQMQADAAGSRHFRFARTITYDIKGNAVSSQAEIGPEKVGAGNLAGIAYFGGAHGGGGTVADPQGALDDESPRFESAIADIAGKFLS